MPDLVARLSGLHATLTTRLSLQESMLSLYGRLDMVLSQIEMRSSIAPAPLAPRTENKNLNDSDRVVRYVEGESEEDEDQMEVEVERDSGDEASSVEDVELGGDSQDDESEESEELDDEGSESENEDPAANGFIDDEAEEISEEEDEDSE
jgi:U3 small nucleolar RNA-associated protein 5